MITTTGVATDWGTSALFLQGAQWWWAGAGAQIRGGIPPPQWDADGPSSVTSDYSGVISSRSNGPADSLPRFRYHLIANVAWGDGHAKGVHKGALGWCADMFVAGAYVNPFGNGGLYDDSSTFHPGHVCAGYSQD